MVTCPKCGSHRIRRAHDVLTPVVHTITGQRKFACSQCGWTGWKDRAEFEADEGTNRGEARDSDRNSGRDSGRNSSRGTSTPASADAAGGRSSKRSRRGRGRLLGHNGDAPPSGRTVVTSDELTAAGLPAREPAAPVIQSDELEQMGLPHREIEDDGAEETRALQGKGANQKTAGGRGGRGGRHHGRHHHSSGSGSRSRSSQEVVRATMIVLVLLGLVWGASKACSVLSPPPDETTQNPG